MDSILDGCAKGWNSCKHNQNVLGSKKNCDDIKGDGCVHNILVEWLSLNLIIIIDSLTHFHELHILENEKWHLEQKVDNEEDAAYPLF